MGKTRLRDVNPEALQMIAETFRVLADPARLRILQLLEEQEHNVGQLVTALGISQPSVSKHLKLLLGAGLVARRQSGSAVYYHIADAMVVDLCNLVCHGLQRKIRAQAEASLRALGVPWEDLGPESVSTGNPGDG